MIELLSFPGYFSCDAHGFIKCQKDLGFQFASQTSSLTLHNGKNVIYLHSTKTRQKLHDYFSAMSGSEFKNNRFESHDAASDLVASGYSAERLVTVVIFFEPTTISVEKLFKL